VNRHARIVQRWTIAGALFGIVSGAIGLPPDVISWQVIVAASAVAGCGLMWAVSAWLVANAMTRRDRRSTHR
jgi:hypothetical protein